MANEIVPFAELTKSLAERFEVEPQELIATVKAACFPGGAASNAQLMMLLSFAKNYDLNPLAKECYAFISGGRMSIGVQVDGWSKIANRQESYDGQDIEYENNDKGDLVAITSRTYVKGRTHPTVYRAVLKEWKRNTDVWNSMPSHQLYVKARNEGIRFAFGIPAYDPDDIERIATTRVIETTAKSNGTGAVDESTGEVVNAVPSPDLTIGPIDETPATVDVKLETSADVAQRTEQPDSNGTVAGSTPAVGATETKRVRKQKPDADAPADGPRAKLDKLIERHVSAARLNLLLGQRNVVDVKELNDDQVVELINLIEKRTK